MRHEDESAWGEYYEEARAALVRMAETRPDVLIGLMPHEESRPAYLKEALSRADREMFKGMGIDDG